MFSIPGKTPSKVLEMYFLAKEELFRNIEHSQLAETPIKQSTSSRIDREVELTSKAFTRLRPSTCVKPAPEAHII